MTCLCLIVVLVSLCLQCNHCDGFLSSSSTSSSSSRVHTAAMTSRRLKSIDRDVLTDIISGSNKKLLRKVMSRAKTIDYDDDDKESLALDVLNILLDKFGDLSSVIGNDSDQDDDDIDVDNDNDDDDDDGDINDRSKLFDGVIRVYCTHSQPSFSMPWQRQKQEFSTSTGFIIDGNRILTNAHAVEYGSLIQVKKRQSEKKYVASVVAVGHECDLAILSVVDETFWEGLEPLKFGNIPELLEDVSVIGFPVGGDSLSITSGVVSRIEMQEYAQASAELLAIQIDAAINPGNCSYYVFI